MARTPKKTRTSAKAGKAQPAQAKAVAEKPRLSLVGLQSQLIDIETRLKRAEANTRRKNKALKDQFKTLASGTGTHSATLDRQLSALTRKFESDVSDMHDEVRRSLSTALQNPQAEILQAAINQASDRIGASETAQRTALSVINRSLADLALAVDTRLSEEEKTRHTAMMSMKRAQEGLEHRLNGAIEQSEAQTALRLSSLEAENAKALTEVGDKVVSFAQDLNNRTQDTELLLKQQINELTLQNKAELDQFRSSVMRRVESLEDNLRGTDSHLDRSIASLGSRLEGLEYGLTPHALNSENQNPTQEVEPTNERQSISPQPLNSEPLQDAFTPDEPQHAVELQLSGDQSRTVQYTQPLAQNPYAAGVQPQIQQQPYGADNAPALATATYEGPAVPYDPSSHANPYEVAPIHTAAAPPPYAAQTHAPITRDNEVLAIEDIPLPYADPAYAEAQASPSDETMKAARPGFFKSKTVKKQKAPKLKKAKAANASPLLTPRNLRVGAMAAGLGIMVFVASQTVFKPDAAGNPLIAESSQGGLMQANASQSAVEMAPPIGQYADNKAQPIESGSRSETILETNVSAGDPVAQLQLGLSYLESGKTDEGVALIRQAANQDQPAALYRLAKLYESGEGVTADANTARQLTDRAARGGNRIAMHDLALYYAEGRGGVEIDMKQAAEWFEKAAQRGVVDSQFNLGVLYESGQGVTQRVETAFYWYGVAANQGDQTAQARLTILRGQLPADVISSADTKIAAFKPRKIDPAANGIFRDGAKTAETDAVKSSVAKTQTLLSDLGYEVGAADGAIGPKTRSAIISFERSNGLPETGRVNAALVERLELAAGA